MICKRLRRYLAKAFLLVVVVAALLCCHGCTIHFKGEKLELDMERQRVEYDSIYDLEKMDLFGGSSSEWSRHSGSY